MTKIPNKAKCVFKGILFDVYNWKQKMFDGSFETFEAIKRKDSVQIIAVTNTNKIILLNEEQPHIGKFLSLPGGVIDKNEKPQIAAKRELLEETAMNCEKLVEFKQTTSGSKIDWTTYYYIAKNCELKNKKQKLDSGEKISIIEVSFEEFLEKIETKEFRNKQFSDIIFRIKHNKIELEKFKKILFE